MLAKNFINKYVALFMGLSVAVAISFRFLELPMRIVIAKGSLSCYELVYGKNSASTIAFMNSIVEALGNSERAVFESDDAGLADLQISRVAFERSTKLIPLNDALIIRSAKNLLRAHWETKVDQGFVKDYDQIGWFMKSRYGCESKTFLSFFPNAKFKQDCWHDYISKEEDERMIAEYRKTVMERSRFGRWLVKSLSGQPCY